MAQDATDITYIRAWKGLLADEDRKEASGSMTVPAVLDNLVPVTAMVTKELTERLCPQGVLHKIVVALEELFVNVCRYAYAGQDEPGDVTVSYVYRADPSTILVELRDSGVPFDPVKREDPTRPSSIQETKIGGLGIFMVKKHMDELRYAREDNDNVVTFTKSW